MYKIDFAKKWNVIFDKENNKYKSDLSKNYLLSFTNLTKNKIGLDLLKIPNQNLTAAAEFGKILMENLELIINQKLEISKIAIYYQKIIIDLLNFIDLNIKNIKIKECEKLICDDRKIGFVDLVGKKNKTNWVFEIKTISNFQKIKKAWVSQLAYYASIIEHQLKPNQEHYSYVLLIWDKKKEKWFFERVNKKLIEKHKKIIKNFLEII